MRGKPERYLCNKFPLRIIPAHAGQTSSWELFMSGNKDHPRACGANIISVALCFIRLGSSPRMRGKPIGAFRFFGCVRIIPAHAGQTASGFPHGERMPDHPRACGANGFIICDASLLFGSSPRMRGKPKADAGDVETRRIIPAHAGQTPYRHSFPCRNTDHPRACGANSDVGWSLMPGSGSSPRMRGKPTHRYPCIRERRIIPAHAGQTKR